jgi:hypothetical protein
VRFKNSHSILCLSLFRQGTVNLDRRDMSAAASKRIADDGDDMTSEARAKPAYGRGNFG